MSTWSRRSLVTLTLLALLTPVAVSAAFNVTKPTFSSGATATAGGSFVLGATTGEAGVVGASSGGSFRLTEGFWHPNMGVATSVTPWSPAPAPEPVPVNFANGFAGNHPNPFSRSTVISFTVAEPSPVLLSVYDVGGRRVRTLVDGALGAGRHDISWNADDSHGHAMASGIYFMRLAIGRWSETRRILCSR